MKRPTKQRHVAAALMTVLGAGLLASCGPSAADLQQIKSEEESARAEAQSERRGREEAEQKEKSMEREVKKLKEEVDEAQQDRAKLEDAIKKLDKEFSDYKDKYKAAIMQKLPGLAIKPLVYDKKSYDNLTVRAIDGNLLTIAHPYGLLHLKASDLPEDTQAFLALDQKTEFHSKVALLLKELKNRELLSKGVFPSEPKVAKKPANGKPEPPAPRPNAFDLELMKFIAQVTVSTDRGESGSGSGFIARQGNATYFFTSAHMVSGVSTISTITSDGRRFTLPDALEMADEDEAFDVVRFKLPGGNVPGLDLASDPMDVKVGDKVIAMGDSGGAGVIPVLEGKVQAVGAFWVEADAPTIRGNSGGPLMLDGTTKVVGIVTHYMNPYGSSMGATPFNGVRRLCLRPDQIVKWRPSSLTRLKNEPKILDQIELDNTVLQSLMSISFGDQGVTGASEDQLISGGRSPMGASIANSLRNVNAFFTRSHPTSGSRGKQAQLAPTAIREQCSIFVNAVLAAYGSNVAGVDEKSYSRFNRLRFRELADKRKSVCLALNSHLNGEITRVDPYSTK